MFINLMKCTYIHKLKKLRLSNRISKNKSTLKYILLKLQNTKDKEIIKTSRNKREITFQWVQVKTDHWLFKATMENWKSSLCWEKNNYKPRTLYPVKNLSRMKKHKHFIQRKNKKTCHQQITSKGNSKGYTYSKGKVMSNGRSEMQKKNNQQRKW